MSIPRLRFARHFAGIVLLAALGSATGSTEETDATLENIYRDLEIQRDLSVTVGGPRPDGGWMIPAVFGWVILGAAAAGAVGLAVWLMAFDVEAAAAKRRRKRTRAQGVDVPDDNIAPASADWLRDADDLARQGRFAEAIHRLLLGVLGRLGRTSGHDATTAREIVRAHVGPHARRLGALVRASELVHFGGRPGTREQYDRCRLDALELDGALDLAPA